MFWHKESNWFGIMKARYYEPAVSRSGNLNKITVRACREPMCIFFFVKRTK
jgi:hypothetical protein